MSARCRGSRIHEATGKFSSRCVLPDLRSEALLIELHRHWLARDMPRNSRPHIGEYAGKTNAFADCKAMQPASRAGAGGRFSAAESPREKRRLLTVVLQH